MNRSSIPTENSSPAADARVLLHHDLASPGSVAATQDDNDTTATIASLQARITSLERELVETRMELASSKSSEDYLRLQLSKMSARNPNSASSNNAQEVVLAVAVAAAAESSSAQDNGSVDVEHARWFNQGNVGEVRRVPTSDPFSRKSKTVHRGRKTTAKRVLNPGSCSSGLDLLALAQQAGSTSSGCAILTTARSVHSLSRPTKLGKLNPNSCASGLNLFADLQEAQATGAASSTSSGQHLMLRRNHQSTSSSNGALNSLLLHLGNARILSASSLRRNGGATSGNNMRSSGNSRQLGGSKRNADWDLF